MYLFLQTFNYKIEKGFYNSIPFIMEPSETSTLRYFNSYSTFSNINTLLRYIHDTPELDTIPIITVHQRGPKEVPFRSLTKHTRTPNTVTRS